MHKIIHETFELDLSNTSISLNDDNSWFSDSFNTKYSFPFTMELSDEIKVIFEDLLNYRSKEIVVEYQVTYVFNDIKEAAILKATGVDDSIEFELKYGLDNFPNFNKKLNQLGLQIFNTSDIYAHAKTIISQTWPAVNYNFPQIQVDKFDNTNQMWTHFEKILNKYVDGDFVTNTVVDDIPHNKNIMQPMPYFLHIMKQGFADAGYELKGDVLEIPALKKKLLYIDTEYYKLLEQANISTNVLGTDLVNSQGRLANFNKSITLPQSGRYQIAGNVNIYGLWKTWTWATIKYRDKVLWTASKKEKKHHSGYIYSYDIDIIFDTVNDSGPHELTFESTQYKDDDSAICDLQTSSLYFFDNAGVASPNVIQNNTVDLNKLVPDITFGNFVTTVKNWYNLYITTKGKEIWMNYISKELNYEEAIDFSEFQTKPKRETNDGLSFLLQFAEPNDEKNKHKAYFFNTDGNSTSGYVTDDQTQEITIQAFPFLNEFYNGVWTAHAIESEPNKIYAVLYDGLDSSGVNTTSDPAPMLLPEVAENHYKDWFNFRLTSINFKWNFTCFIESLNKVSSKSKIFSYGRYFILKSLNKTQIAKDEFEVEFDAYTLK